MFHIVFDAKGAEQINAAMDMDEALDGETIVFQDDFSVGPLMDLDSELGRQNRQAWWTQVRPEDSGADAEMDSEKLNGLLQRMSEEEFDQIWIWVAPNVRDVCGYYWLISRLQSFSGRIYVLSLNNLPFIGEKGNVFYPVFLSEILPREFTKAKKLARLVSPSEFETDPDEWQRLTTDNKNLRVLEGGKKITQKDDDHYDRMMLPFLQPAFQKLTRMVHAFLQKSPEKVNEFFVAWRFRQLVASGIAEQQGETMRLAVREAEANYE